MDVTYSLFLLTEMMSYSEFIVAADSNHESEYDQVMKDDELAKSRDLNYRHL